MTISGTHELVINSAPYPCAGTESIGNPTLSKGLYFVPASHSWDDSWELAVDLLVEINTSREEVVAVTCLTVQEYGIGDSFESAMLDLLTSLGDYYQSLESREANLAPPASKDLEILRRMVNTTTGNRRGR